MTSVAILAAMMVSVFAGFAFGFGLVRTERDDLRATQILTQKIEALRLCTYSQLSNCPATFTDWYNPSGTTNNTAGTVYGGTISLGTPTNLPAAYQGQVRLITVSVQWTNYNHSQPLVHNRQMQTESAFYGIQNYIYGTHP